MNLEIFTLCEGATTKSGKLDIIGAFDTLWARKFPFSAGIIFLAVRIRFERHEIGHHKFTLRFADEDGHEIADTLEGELTVTFARAGPFSTVATAQPLRPLPFERPGLFALHIDVDDAELGVLPFYVVETPT